MRALLVANLVSVAGGGVSLVALPWFVLLTTGSPVATGLAAACEVLPLVAVAMVSGTVVDRLGAAATRIASDVVSAVTVLAVPVLHATVGIAFWQLLLLVAVNGAVRAPAPAASLVLLHELCAAAGTSPDRARSTYTAGVRLAGALSAPLGGVLIGAWGAPAALVVDAASFAVSAAVLAAVLRLRRPAGPADADREDPGPGSPRRRPWAGLRALAEDRLLRGLTAVVLVLSVLEGAWAGVLAPAYGQRVLDDPAVLGLLLGVFGLGALAGTLLHPPVAGRTDPHLLVWACLGTATAVRFGALAARPALPVLVAALLAAGLASGLLGPLWLGLLADRTATGLHGHVFSVVSGGEQGGIALGALVGGLVLSRVTVPVALAAAAVIGAALTLWAATAAPLAALHRARTPPAAPGTGHG